MKERLLREFAERFGNAEGAQVYFAPGRVNLIGEHTDYNGGHVFPCALDIGTYAVVRKRQDKRLFFYSMNYPETGIINSSLTGQLEHDDEDGWANYPKGGQLNRYSISVYGISAIRELEQVNFHQTFLGVTGYSMKAGFTCGNNEEAMLKRTAIEQAEQVVVLMDASKTDIKSTYTICGLADVDIIISDGNLPKEFLLACETHHITVY